MNFTNDNFHKFRKFDFLKLNSGILALARIVGQGFYFYYLLLLRNKATNCSQKQLLHISARHRRRVGKIIVDGTAEHRPSKWAVAPTNIVGGYGGRSVRRRALFEPEKEITIIVISVRIYEEPRVHELYN